ncbi:MAG: NUDIX hydrolase [Ruegeria sp.]
MVPQSAALCYRIRAEGPEILLITTRRTGRWIIPKGGMMTGLSGSETAAQEAWEEAGVTGCCDTRIIGQFSFVKRRKGIGQVLYSVEVYPLRVFGLSDEFPEVAQRRRQWFVPEMAAQNVSIRNLSALLRDIPFNPH